MKTTPCIRPRLLPLLALPLLVVWGCGSEPQQETDSARDQTGQQDRTVSRTAKDHQQRPTSVYGIDEVLPASLVQSPAVPDDTAPSPFDPEGEGPVPESNLGHLDIDHRREGERLFSDKQYLAAATHLTIAAERDPDHWYTHYLLGLSLWKSGDLVGAEATLRRSIKLKENFPKSFINLSRVLNDAGRSQDALEAAENAVSLSPTNSDALYLKGRSLANLGRNDEAVEVLRVCIDQAPDHGDARNRLGLLLIQTGRFEESVTWLESAAELLPQVEYVRNNLGMAYENVGRMRDAEIQYAAAIELSPENERLQTNLARVQPLPDTMTFVARSDEEPADLTVTDEADSSLVTEDTVGASVTDDPADSVTAEDPAGNLVSGTSQDDVVTEDSVVVEEDETGTP